MILPLNIPQSCNEAYMTEGVSKKTLRGSIVFLEIWGQSPPTFAFMHEGACYHDLPFEAFKVDLYHPWEVVAGDAPETFTPPGTKAWIFTREGAPLAKVQVAIGLVWPKANLICYLCYDSSGKLFFWPVHKILFGTSGSFGSSPKLPDWKKNRSVGGSHGTGSGANLEVR